MGNKKFYYLDGSEDDLLNIFKNPSFDENRDWYKYSTNWPLKYHLSPLRKNLVNWLNFGKNSINVLEFGAGCGAITSYFVSLDNVERIVAVEGEKKRAEIIKLRCKNAVNLEIVVSNIEDYKSNSKFDVVLLIGVLEYSGKYAKSANPFEKILFKVASLIKEEGFLIVGIENQLGCKYLAGYNEDHYWEPFEGISGYPNFSGIRTFDKQTLKNKLKRAGFAEQKWFYPLPDYKMPNLILSDRVFNTPDFDWLDIANFPTADPTFHGKPLFNEKEFLKTLSVNNIASIFMNSFLILASKVPVMKNLDPLLAVKINSLRSVSFQKKNFFLLHNNSEIRVVNNLFANESSSKFSNYKQEESELYFKKYRNLFSLIIDSIYHNRFKLAADYLYKWLDVIEKKKIKRITSDMAVKFKNFCQKYLGFQVYNDNITWISGKYIDLIPYNCLIYKYLSHDVKIIDQEWDINIDIPIEFVIDRGMYYLQAKLHQYTDCNWMKPSGVWNLPSGLAKLLPNSITYPNIPSLIFFDYWFHRCVEVGDFFYKLNENDRKIAQNRITRILGRKRSLKDKFLDYTASISVIKKLSRSIVSRSYCNE